jgi:hypothetical protein
MTQMEEDLKDIGRTMKKVLRLAYLRPLLEGTETKPFELNEEEISLMLEEHDETIKTDMDILSECLRAAYDLGAARGASPEIFSDEIVIEGNTP